MPGDTPVAATPLAAAGVASAALLRALTVHLTVQTLKSWLQSPWVCDPNC